MFIDQDRGLQGLVTGWLAGFGSGIRRSPSLMEPLHTK